MGSAQPISSCASRPHVSPPNITAGSLDWGYPRRDLRSDGQPCSSRMGLHRFDLSVRLARRIHKNLPNVLEVVELFASKEFPETGLRLAFQDAICPFAFICTNQIHSTARKQYMLYVLTVSGVAYCLYLRSPFTYISGSNFPRDEILEFDLEKHMTAKITAVAATSGCLVTGRRDGSIGCFRLGGLGFDAPDFYTQLRDDAGLGRLWNIMSRKQTTAKFFGTNGSPTCRD